MSDAVKNEIIRKLEYIERIAHEARELISDTGWQKKADPELIETIQTQSEMISVLLQKLLQGRGADPDVDSKFKRTAQKYIEIMKAELALEMEEADIDYLEYLKRKRLKR